MSPLRTGVIVGQEGAMGGMAGGWPHQPHKGVDVDPLHHKLSEASLLFF